MVLIYKVVTRMTCGAKEDSNKIWPLSVKQKGHSKTSIIKNEACIQLAILLFSANLDVI